MSNNNLDECRPNTIARRCGPPGLNRSNDRFLRKVNRSDHAFRAAGSPSAARFKEIGRESFCPRRRGTRRHQHDLREELTGLRGGIRRGLLGPSLEGGFCFCEERLGGGRIDIGIGIGDVSGDDIADGVREVDPGIDGAAECDEVVPCNGRVIICDGSMQRNVVCNVVSIDVDLRIGIRGVSGGGVARKIRGCSVSLHDCSEIGINIVPVWPRDGEEAGVGFVDRPSRGRVNK